MNKLLNKIEHTNETKRRFIISPASLSLLLFLVVAIFGLEIAATVITKEPAALAYSCNKCKIENWNVTLFNIVCPYGNCPKFPDETGGCDMNNPKICKNNCQQADGGCGDAFGGSAMGNNTYTAPTNFRCAYGSSALAGYTPTVTDKGDHFSWTCKSSKGYSITVGAPKIIDGACGATNNACTAGNLNDTADGSTTYDWQCTGINNGTTAYCSLPRPVAGVCGASVNSCSVGTFSDTTDTTQARWYCLGINSGATSPLCTANIPCTVNSFTATPSGGTATSTGPVDIVKGSSVAFTGSCTAAVSTTMNYGEGSTVSAPGSHTYNTLGTYTSSYSCVGSNGTTTTRSIIVNVNSRTCSITTFSATPTNTINTTPVVFTWAMSGADRSKISYRGDGTYNLITTSPVSNTYSQAGSYNAQLLGEVVDSGTGTVENSCTRTIPITITLPLSCTVTPNDGLAPLVVSVNVLGGTGTSYNYTMSPGNTINGKPSPFYYTYQAAGSYAISIHSNTGQNATCAPNPVVVKSPKYNQGGEVAP